VPLVLATSLVDLGSGHVTYSRVALKCKCGGLFSSELCFCWWLARRGLEVFEQTLLDDATVLTGAIRQLFTDTGSLGDGCGYSGIALVSINVVTLRRAGLVLGWMTVYQPPKSTQPSTLRGR